MLAVELIRKKRDGKELTAKEIDFLVQGFTRKEIPDYQFSAFLMAAYIRGMTDEETLHLTRSYIESGEILDLKGIEPKIDKHSTGGVGDKVSIVLAPLVASCGVKVPMISGRGLGHTGGTLDKLESIPGFRTSLSIKEIRKQLENIGFVICGQTGELAPADGKIYALRDVTGTVNSISLIAASIMSKKLAEDIDGLVLDVKTGSGAFMEDMNDALKLANKMCTIGHLYGKRTVALITSMDEPLGWAVGNGVEIAECIQILKKGSGDNNLIELIKVLASFMLLISEKSPDYSSARKKVEQALSQGLAYQKFREMIKAQGGDLSFIEQPESLYETQYRKPVTSASDGFIQGIDTRKVGIAGLVLGAGRKKIEDEIDHSVGIIVRKKIGDKVAKGEVLVELLGNNEENLTEAENLIKQAYTISGNKKEPLPIIHYIVDYAHKVEWQEFCKNPVYPFKDR